MRPMRPDYSAEWVLEPTVTCDKSGRSLNICDAKYDQSRVPFTTSIKLNLSNFVIHVPPWQHFLLVFLNLICSA